MTGGLVLQAGRVLPGPGRAVIRDGAVRITAGRVDAVGPAAAMAVPNCARVIALPDAVLTPGLVNAHQHGRGISQLLMGYPDGPLEPWIAGRRLHGPPDVHAVTRLAAEAMLAHGVTATLHANYTYGSGNYEAELRAQITAYRDAGLRATVCVGLQDRGGLVYPDGDAAAFVAGLPSGARALVTRPAPPPYMPGWHAARVLMDQLQAEYAGVDLLRLAWGPAGPQWVSDDLWHALAVDAAARGVGVHFHLLESPAQAAAVQRLYPEGTLARMRGLGVFAARTSCAHGVHMTADDMAVARAEGLPVVLNAGSNMRLGNGPPPVAALRAAGVRLAVGTDNCALQDDEDLLAELRLAMLMGRDDSRATVPGARPSATEAGDVGHDPAAAWAMATTGGAAAAFLPDGHGVIAPGAPADLAAFTIAGIGDRARMTDGVPDDRLAELLIARGTGRDCMLTVVAGHVRYAATPEDRARLDHWRAVAAASVAARTDAAPAAAVGELQAALRAHYARRAGS